ncbi:C45 family autoproteolytic acyltransferase/hydolase [Archangium lipolyticum]|uniref:C45 family autoproteolytic acyltransferase/hydolase n=1 Tax=Archangium lipolyticum TaxID=2970465 RepID=UPI002149FA46|nr:C45 family peptidase [Archangium lipolyticum]
MTTLRVIECRGTPRQIGQQWGEASRENLRASAEYLFQTMALGPLKAPREDVMRAALKLEANVRAFDPGALELIQGQAEGAGLPYEDAFALQCTLELAINYAQVGAMCTSLAVTGEATADGQALIGQTIDWNPDATVELLRIRHSDGREQLSLCLSGSPYYHLNSDGVGNCANLTLVAPKPCPSLVPLSVYVPKAMRQPSLSAALEVLVTAARGIGYYHLADAHGRVVGIESTYDDHVLLQPERGVLVHANHYQSERFREQDITRQFVPCTVKRKDRIAERVAAEHGRLTPESVMRLLGDHGTPEGRICMHDTPAAPGTMPMETKATVVMAPARRTMWVAVGPACREPFTEIRL